MTPDLAPRGERTVRVVVGLLVVALGALFLAGNLGVVDAKELVPRLFPLALAAVGAAILAAPGRRGAARAWAPRARWRSAPTGAGCWR